MEFANRISLKCSHHKKEMVTVGGEVIAISWIVVTISECVHIQIHQVVHLKHAAE